MRNLGLLFSLYAAFLAGCATSPRSMPRAAQTSPAPGASTSSSTPPASGPASPAPPSTDPTAPAPAPSSPAPPNSPSPGPSNSAPALSAPAAGTLSVATNELVTGTASVNYIAKLAAQGGTSPYVWSIASGSLPSGLVLDEASGVIVGTPAQTGSGRVEIQVEDAAGHAATKTLSVSVEAGNWATTYHVDSAGGADGNAGTSETAPWKTIAKVNASAFLPGDRILFKRGSVWREQLLMPSSGEAGQPILIGAYGSGADPVISGADLVPSAAWGLCNSCSANTWAASVKVAPNLVLFNGVLGQKRASVSALKNNLDWFWTGNTLYVHFTGNPGSSFRNPGVEAGARQLGIGLFGVSYLTIQNIKVTAANGLPTNAVVYAQAASTGKSTHNISLNHLTVVYGAGDGVRLEDCNACIVQGVSISQMAKSGIGIVAAHGDFPVSSGAILGNTVFDNHRDGIYTNGCAIGDVCGGGTQTRGLFLSGMIISGNTVHDNGEGIYLRWTNHSSVQANAAYNNTDTTDSVAEGGGIEIEASSNNAVQKNLLYGNRMSGIELSNDRGAGTVMTGSASNTVAYNAIHDNGTNGLFSNAVGTHDNTFLYNVIWNHRNGECFIASGMGHQFYGNTCWNNSTGVDIYTPSPALTTGNIKVKNNIIAGSLKFAVQIEPGVSTETIEFDHNDYDLKAGSAFHWSSTTSSFAHWQSSLRVDAHSILASPEFLSFEPSSPGEFAVNPGSPAIDSGGTLAWPFAKGLSAGSTWPDGVKRNAQGVVWNVGAFVANQ